MHKKSTFLNNLTAVKIDYLQFDRQIWTPIQKKGIFFWRGGAVVEFFLGVD